MSNPRFCEAEVSVLSRLIGDEALDTATKFLS